MMQVVTDRMCDIGVCVCVCEKVSVFTVSEIGIFSFFSGVKLSSTEQVVSYKNSAHLVIL